MELHDLCSPRASWLNKPRRMRWAGYAARMGEKKNACRFRWGKFRGREHLENLSIGGKKTLKWILKK